MALCFICEQRMPDPEILEHVRVFHPDLYEEPERWPDGEIAVVTLGEAMGVRNINDAIEQWHTSDSGRRLHEHLGMSEDEYARWVTQQMPAAELAELGYYEGQ